MKATHFSERTREALRQQLFEAVGPSRTAEIADAFEREFIDLKRQDARVLIQYLGGPRTRSRGSRAGLFSPTDHWRVQFETQIADVPPLV